MRSIEVQRVIKIVLDIFDSFLGSKLHFAKSHCLEVVHVSEQEEGDGTNDHCEHREADPEHLERLIEAKHANYADRRCQNPLRAQCECEDLAVVGELNCAQSPLDYHVDGHAEEEQEEGDPNDVDLVDNFLVRCVDIQEVVSEYGSKCNRDDANED